MENIIKKAIEGGWKPKYGQEVVIRDLEGKELGRTIVKDTPESEMVCDPLFWQALSQNCGWGIKINAYKGDVHVNHKHNNGECTDMCVVPSVENALNFHRINLTKNWDSAIKYLGEITSLEFK